MKRLSKTILPVLFFFLLVTPVLARGRPATPSSTFSHREKLEQIRERVRERREAIRMKIRERRATRAARLAEKRKERIRFFFGRLMRRMRAAIERLERLISRIESRLSKIEANNEEIDTSTIRVKLDEAKDKLVEASAALTQAQTSLEDILSADNPKEAFADIRDLIRGVKRQLIEIHRILVQVIGDIKGLRVGPRSPQPEATSLPEGE